MSTTPRTDAAQFPADHAKVVWADFARELELENAKLRAALEWIRIEAEKHPEHGYQVILEITNKALPVLAALAQPLKSTP